MDAFEVDVDGLDDVVYALRDVGIYVEEPVGALEEIAERGAQAVEAHTPQRSGRLRGKVSGRRSRGKAVITASTEYAGVINYGDPARNIAPAEYLQQGEADVLPEAVRLLEDDINNQIQKEHFQ